MDCMEGMKQFPDKFFELASVYTKCNFYFGIRDNRVLCRGDKINEMRII